MSLDQSVANRSVRRLSALTLASLCFGGAASASRGSSSDAWQVSMDGGFVSQFDGSLDTGGEFGSDRYFLRAGLSRRIDADWSAGLSLGYGETRYDFSGGSGIGGSAPWSRIRQLRVSASLRFRADEHWSFIAIPSLRYFEESGAEGDGSQVGLLAAAAYRFSDRLTLGPGLGVFSGLGEDSDVFPILLVDWKIAENWQLETGRGLGASRGPGLSLKWRPSGEWTFGLGARYEKTRFRLDGAGAAPGGVGEDRSVPVSLTATYAPTPQVDITLLGGVEFAGSLKLEDSQRRLLTQSDYDTAPFAGLSINIRY